LPAAAEKDVRSNIGYQGDKRTRSTHFEFFAFDPQRTWLLPRNEQYLGLNVLAYRYSKRGQGRVLTMPPTHPLEKFFESRWIAGGASESAIAEAEAALGVRFPPSYRSFLARFGAANGHGFEIAGLFHYPDKSHPPLWLDVVTLNLKWVSQLARGIQPRYVAIGHDGGDYTFYLDTGAPEPESPVVALGPGVDYVVVARNFNAYVIARTKDALRSPFNVVF
jgi:SMI1-KNR4 cell-wall